MPSFEDLTGKKIGYLTVLHRASDWIQPSGQHKRMWHCICDCGKECDVRASDIKSGNTTSCGCQSSRKRSVGLEDLTGKCFGDYTVISRAPNKITPSGQQVRVWHCKCKKCGLERDIQASLLKNFSGKCVCQKSVKETVIRKAKNTSSPIKKNTSKKQKQNLELVNPVLASEWHPTKNGDSVPKDVFPTSKLNVWWLGKCGHEWEATIASRTRGSNCPFCSNRQLLKGFNDFETLHKELLKEWDYDKNVVSPSNIVAMSTKVWWKCNLNHSYEMTIAKRVGEQKCGCPYCSVPAKKILKGFNDLATLYPEILNEWDYEKNTVKPDEITPGSAVKVWWKCALGHSYDSPISSRVGKQKCGCPYCSVPAKRILVGFNDLATTHPLLLEEWDYEKNSVLPTEITFGTAKKIWWRCANGHSYEQSTVYKAKSKSKSTCPYCSKKKVLSGFNDLASTHAYIIDEWDYEKNIVSPDEIGVGTHQKIWWKCPFGHSYQAYPSNRCGMLRSGCPVCSKENHTSFPEQSVLYYVKKHFDDAINSDRTRIGMELDIYIPSIDTGIEYDGATWHKNNSYETVKNSTCIKEGVKLIRIRENGLDEYEDCICISRENNRSSESLKTVIIELLNMLGVYDADIDVDRDAGLIYSSYIETRKEKSLASVYPEIAAEWHPTKNGDLSPMMVSPIANKKVWWLGKCGHEYNMEIGNRTNQNCKCPYCSGKRILIGFNDLESWCKNNDMQLLDEWDYSKNVILPTEVTKSSDKVVFWKCRKCSNVWKTKIDSRTRMKSGCPRCAAYYRNTKPVINLDTQKVYESMIEAEKELNINRACIGNVCKGKQKTAGGYRWAYYEVEDS